MKVAFRVDATSQIGAGHFMRCLTLADCLKAYCTRICFVSRHLPEYLQTMLVEKGHDFIPLNSPNVGNNQDQLQHSAWLGVSQNQDALDCILELKDVVWDWLIVDHYALDFRWESKLREVAVKILVIDDLADRQHDCDVLLDQNLYVDMDTRYIGKVPRDCKLLLGPRYALLRDEFIRMRQYAKPRSGKIKNILVFFGSVDTDNHTLTAINALINVGSGNLHVDIVIGIQHPCIAEIKALCSDNNFVCHIQTNRMAKLMTKADLAIGAGGISTYERLYLRLPAILKAISLNQLEPLTYMSKMGLFDLFSTQQDLERKLEKILAHENSSPPDCVEDGNKKLLELIVTDFTQLLIPCALDVRRTFGWLQNKQLRDDFVIAEVPQLEQHFLYWRKILNDPEQRIYSIMYFGKHVGNCGLKNINAENATSELWIYLADISARGRGVAKCAVLKLLSIAKNELACISVCLHVAKTNIAAIRLYKNSGFHEVHMPLTGRWSGCDAEILLMECLL